MARVFWTANERTAVVQETVRRLRIEPLTPIFKAVGEAQTAVLPHHRRRKIVAMKAMGDVGDMIKRELAKPVESVLVSDREAPAPGDAIAQAAREIAQRFEEELRTALLEATRRIVNEAKNTKL